MERVVLSLRFGSLYPWKRDALLEFWVVLVSVAWNSFIAERNEDTAPAMAMADTMLHLSHQNLLDHLLCKSPLLIWMRDIHLPHHRIIDIGHIWNLHRYYVCATPLANELTYIGIGHLGGNMCLTLRERI